jgi:hypothetical protein
MNFIHMALESLNYDREVNMRTYTRTTPSGDTLRTPESPRSPRINLSTPDTVVLETITSELRDERFVLLRPKYTPKIEVPASWITTDPNRVVEFIQDVKLEDDDDAIAYDTETNGLTVFGNPEFRMVGMGFSHKDQGIYLDTSNMSHRDIAEVLNLVDSTLRNAGMSLICHNLFYDASVTRFYLGGRRDLPYKACTYGLYKYLSSEGFFLQSWSLKAAQKDMLLWPETNEVDRDAWLLSNGYITGPYGVESSDTPAERDAKIAHIAAGIAEGKTYKIDKAKMYLTPPEIMGPYCVLDCYSTYMFYREVLLPAMRKYTTAMFTWFHKEVFVDTLVHECVTNYQEGIFIDKKILEDYDVKLIGSLTKIQRKVYRDNREAIDEINADHLAKHAETCPETRYKLVKKTDGKCPEKYAKNGKVSKNYIKYMLRNRKYLRDLKVGGEISKAYAKYRAFRRELKYYQKHYPIYDPQYVPERFKDYIFNLNSPAQKLKILYRNITLREIEPYVSEKKPGAFLLPNGIELSYNRKSGSRPTGKSALLAIQGNGSAIDKYNKEVKKQQFTRSALGKITPEGRIHLPVKVPGTLTTRLGGDGGLNIQNIVKDSAFLKAWRIKDPTKTVIANIDFAALEPHVLTELSQDKAMLALYGPGAKPNDVYIFTAALMGGILGQPFLDDGYDPKNPTKDAIDRCKKNHKKLRNAVKALALSDDYGSGVKKKFTSLRILGYDFTLAQIKDAQERLNAAYAGKKAFGKMLQTEHEKNGGYVLDGFGFPVAVTPDKLKDCVNRVVQRTGHMILMLFLYKVTQLMKLAGIRYRWIIVDYHDEIDPEISIADAEKVKQIYADALTWINNEFLKCTVKLKAEPQFAFSLAEIKVEGYREEDEDLAEILDELND